MDVKLKAYRPGTAHSSSLSGSHDNLALQNTPSAHGTKRSINRNRKCGPGRTSYHGAVFCCEVSAAERVVHMIIGVSQDFPFSYATFVKMLGEEDGRRPQTIRNGIVKRQTKSTEKERICQGAWRSQL